jgi:DNA mismatch repair protein MLH1
LASISHIAHLSVTTRTKDSNCAWKAYYADGKLVPAKPGQAPDPKPIAGRGGTQITVEDLFYNVPTRRRAFRSASDEYAKIVDIVGRYAVHCSGVAFSCKKHGDSGTSISTPANLSTVERIRQVHGGNVANELIEISSEDSRWGFKAHGWTSNANYSVKKTSLLLFINHRAVESSNIRKAVEQTYSNFLPKGGHPFTYLSLEIDPQRVDVNIHPTKREVNFLNEDEIIEQICTDIRISLANVDTSRTFTTQTLLPGAKIPLATASRSANGGTDTAPTPVKTSKPYENNLVRTDSKIRKITSMLPSGMARSNTEDEAAADMPPNDDLEYEYSDREPINCRLVTVKELRAEVREEMHNGLTEVFAGHTFVGIVDEHRRLAAIQGGVHLFLVDYGAVCNEYFYQIGLTDFGNFGTIRLNPPLNLKETLTLGAEFEKETMSEAEREGFDIEQVVSLASKKLISRAEMLLEYFSLEISPEGEILTLPLLMKGYMPSLAKLPRFLLRLGPYVDWESEKGCFESFLKELASFYVPEQLPPTPGPGEVEDDIDEEIKARRAYVRRVVENVMFPAFRARLIATKALLKGAVLEVADLKGLYRIFERC